MTPREEREQLEREILSPYAALAALSRGRQRAETPCDIRTCFQRDRDRIIHCKAFRRLNHKTQVFIAPEGDHYRNRLTHTLEVMQIARNMARALRLNEDLTEAIALAHDLGHTPFGHAGEWALDKVYQEFDPQGRFRHAEQSLRVVELLEREGAGLNLSWEVRDGILTHSKGMEDISFNFSGYDRPLPATLEGQLVRLADRIAYVNHDAEDALHAGIIGREDLPRVARERLGDSLRERVNVMILDVVKFSRERGEVIMSEPVTEAMEALKDFLFGAVYTRYAINEEELQRVEEVIAGLFGHYMKHPEHLPGGGAGLKVDRARARMVCDYVAGMTDRFARSQFVTHFVPRSWPTP